MFVGGQPPAPEEVPEAGCYVDLLASGGLGGHVLELTQPGSAADLRVRVVNDDGG